MAEVEAARAEKEERKREKNRKKRHAYRERQREKQYMPKGSPRGNWSCHNRTQQEKDNRPGSKKKREKKQNNKALKKKKETSWKAPKNEQEWEIMFDEAFCDGDFRMMKKLFRVSLLRAATRGDNVSGTAATATPAKRAIKKYRMLSIKYHPDRHHGRQSGGRCYKTAFQALNQAYEDVINRDVFASQL